MKTRKLTPESIAIRAETARAAAEFDAMCRARPRKAPPLRHDTVTLTAGKLALAQDIKQGIYRECPAPLENIGMAVTQSQFHSGGAFESDRR